MSISEGFLRTISGNFNKQWISIGILLGLFAALSLYAFSTMLRELFRIYTYEYIGDLIVFTDSERIFYNFFYALFSSIIGASITLQFIFQNSRQYASPKLRISQRFILKNQYFNTWNWLYFYAKTSILVGMLMWTLPIHYDIDFYNEFRYFFISFVTALYLNLWLDMYRVLRRRLLRWIGIATGLILINSFLLTKLTIINYDEINSKILANTLSHNYRVNLPKTETLEVSHIYRSAKTHVYIGFDKHNDSNIPSIILKDYNNKPFDTIDPKSLALYLEEEEQRFADNYQFNHTIIFNIDSEVKMAFIKDFQNTLKTNVYRKITLASVPKFSKYPAHYQPFEYLGFPHRLHLDCSFVIKQIDSLRALGFTGDQVRFPDFPCYFGADIKNYNRVKVDIYPEGFKVNSRPVTRDKLLTFLWSFFKKYERRGLVLIEVSPECTFDQYLQAVDLIRQPIKKLRNKEALKLTGSIYVNASETDNNKDIMRQIRDKYPYNIIEMSIVDQYLYEYVK